MKNKYIYLFHKIINSVFSTFVINFLLCLKVNSDIFEVNLIFRKDNNYEGVEKSTITKVD